MNAMKHEVLKYRRDLVCCYEFELQHDHATTSEPSRRAQEKVDTGWLLVFQSKRT